MDSITPGTYIVAVSGGVDSMALLHMLQQRPGLTLVVAHVDHGVRPDSQIDQQLVAAVAKKHRLIFEITRLGLGEHPSEEAARQARYNFLQQCSKKYNARGIFLAHHQDDLVETVLLAIMRGTGWRGLAPFVGSNILLRPLLNFTKNDLIAYARKHAIMWHEDSTNTDETYLRNYIRRTLVPMLDQKSAVWRDTFLQQVRKQQEARKNIELRLTTWLDNNAIFYNDALSLRRYDIVMAPQNVAYEIMQQACRRTIGHSLERRLAENAVLFTKTARAHKLMQLGKNWQLRAESANVVVEPRTTVVSLNEQ
jgi:tRNA(Ile)-lysidine synthetase-like protein